MQTGIKRLLVLLVAAASVAVLALTARGREAPQTFDAANPPLAIQTTPAAESGAANVRSAGIATDVQAYAYGQRGYAPTSDKSQTKLWWAANTWWSVMVDPRRHATAIYRLDDAKHAWTSTGVVVDVRDRTYADAQWDGKVLYTGSRTSTGQLLLNKFVPASTRGGWQAVSGFPVLIASNGASSLSIATDSKDRVWAVYNQRDRIWSTVSSPGGGAFGTPTPLTGPKGVKTDDTAAVAAFAGQVGVMWSDQVSGAFRWAHHSDSDPVLRLDVDSNAVMAGLRIADGHIRLLPSRDGRLYAAVKTSLGDKKTDPPASPLLMVLRRERNGSWTRAVAATTADQMTRPQISLSADGSRLYFVASSPQIGGALYLKISRTDRIVFAPGRGTLLLAWPGAVINNATVGRQPVSARTGLVVLASDARRGVYYYAKLPLS